MVRAYVKGTILHDWNYYIQMEYSGAPGVDKGVRLLDAYGEWKKFPEFSVKFGQMKRVFTFENPYSPWDIGYGNYSQLVQKLAGMSDRVGRTLFRRDATRASSSRATCSRQKTIAGCTTKWVCTTDKESITLMKTNKKMSSEASGCHR